MMVVNRISEEAQDRVQETLQEVTPSLFLLFLMTVLLHAP